MLPLNPKLATSNYQFWLQRLLNYYCIQSCPRSGTVITFFIHTVSGKKKTFLPLQHPPKVEVRDGYIDQPRLLFLLVLPPPRAKLETDVCHVVINATWELYSIQDILQHHLTPFQPEAVRRSHPDVCVAASTSPQTPTSGYMEQHSDAADQTRPGQVSFSSLSKN